MFSRVKVNVTTRDKAGKLAPEDGDGRRSRTATGNGDRREH